jgi:hypothetical protein
VDREVALVDREADAGGADLVLDDSRDDVRLNT